MSDDKLISRLRHWLAASPTRRNTVLVTLLIAGFTGGILFWGAFNWSLELSNTEAFCISCHEMEENVYREYKETVHYNNPSGVQAICSDCHVPKEWVHKLVRKVRATNELYHKMLGTISTPEKFAAKRPELATNVWKAMRSTDSRECRNCHSFSAMLLDEQDRFAKRKHEQGFEKGETCIDCHQGIAHKLPDDWKSLWKAEFDQAG